MSAQGLEYHQLLRTRHTWWRPIVGILLGAVLAIAAVMSTGIYALAIAVLQGSPDPVRQVDTWLTGQHVSAETQLVMDIGLGSLIVAAILAVGVVYQRWTTLHSVVGRIRWGWLLRCWLTLLPLWLLVIVGGWAIDGAESRGPSGDWLWVLLLSLVLTPFQAAGEEYATRGLLLQSVGSAFRNPMVGLVVGGAVSVVVFAALHGTLDPWLNLELAAFAIGAIVLCWRTGGIEAAIALHAVNNMVIGVLGALTGLGDDSYINAEAVGDPLWTGVTVAQTAIAVALILWQARRVDITRRAVVERLP
ncbi:MAG: CPBP family intramembrane metalloprotease [Micrococcales bacterium]|nr:CPBP family intramembrane metalloprotease [Micrococcales bacterium]